MTLAQFLDWESAQPLRYEFDGISVIAMTGATEAHALMQANLAIAVGGRLRGKPCRFVGSDLKIQTTNRIRYPDGFVICSPFERNRTVVADPVVIFEILSASTSQIDLIVKNEEYAAIPSVRRYIILAQDSIGGLAFERIENDWVGHLLDETSILEMPEIGISVPVLELYDGVALATPENSAD
jgi:Uma2 family endonuclease